MKRFHVHVAVEDLDESVRFYSTLFATEPTVLKADYARWMLEDPRVNFAISQREESRGVQHLGIQVENETELDEVYARLTKAEGPVIEQKATTCCYAVSDKHWIADPQGVSWETFLSHGEAAVYGGDLAAAPGTTENIGAPANTCCTPKSAVIRKAAASCCAVAAQ